MKLAKRLESQLSSLFMISAIVGIIVLLFSTGVSTIQIKNKAISFITSHVKQISLAEISAQSVSEIDREVRRLYDDWKDTQDVDIRVEVFLDGKLVGKAGQLQRFGMLSYRTTQNNILPSCQKLLVNVDLDLASQIEFDAILIMVFCIFFGSCFVVLRKRLSKTIQEVSAPLEERVDWLAQAAGSLSESNIKNHSFKESSIEELRDLNSALNIFISQIVILGEKVAKTSFNEGRVKMAEQLAHNIKGALATLSLRINNAESLNASEREKLLFAVGQVSDASKSLLRSRRETNDQAQPLLTALDVSNVINKVIEQKKEYLPKNKTITFSLKNLSKQSPVVAFTEAEISSIFSSILDNSIEAIDNAGSVKIYLDQDKDNTIIKISDNGRGISADVLPQLMHEGATFGKKDGNGLGLFHAKQSLEKIHGKIWLQSTLSKGTDVLIIIPIEADLVHPSSDEGTSILLRKNQTLVVLDDDPLIHNAIQVMLGNEEASRALHFHTVNEFEEWLADNGPG